MPSKAGRERKDHHPFAVLSTASFHSTVGLVVGCAITSAPYNRGSSLAVDLGPVPDRPGSHSYVLCQQLQSFDWRARGARPHPIGRLNDSQLEAVMAIVGQILSAGLLDRSADRQLESLRAGPCGRSFE